MHGATIKIIKKMFVLDYVICNMKLEDRTFDIMYHFKCNT